MVYGIDSIVFLDNDQIIEIDFVLSEMEPVEIVFHALSEQIEDFLGILFAVYRYAGKGDFIEADINTMKEILELVQQN